MAKQPSKFSTKKPLTPGELKEFRNYVSQLKKRGLIKSSIDARVARPYRISNGKTLVEIVNKNRGSLNPFVSKTHKQTEAPAAPSKSTVKLQPLKSPISIRTFSPKRKTLAGTLQYIEQHADEIDKMKRPDEKWAFQIDGMRSYTIFSHIEDMVKRLRHYDSVKHLQHKHTHASDQFFSAIKLVRWNDTASNWKPEKQHMNKRQKSHAERQARNRRRKK